jgi:uncharacterized membrane protein
MWLFVIYSFLGWLLEVIFEMTQNGGKFVNKGFLNSPVCPIYGFGIIIVLSFLAPFKSNLLLLFIGSMVLTTVVEFVTGYILEKLFHRKWWDYTEWQFNIKGYVCLGVSAIWGVACVLMITFLQPLIDNLIHWTSSDIGNIIITLLIMIMIADAIVTVVSLLKVKQKIFTMKDILANIESLSETINKDISDGAATAKTMYDNNLREIDNLKKKYHSILSNKTTGYDRIRRAFPGLKLVKSNKPKDKLK